MKPQAIDAHVHCGRVDRMPHQDLRDYVDASSGSGIAGAVVFSPVAEIYDRYDPNFQDDDQWRRARRESNAYLLEIGHPGFEVIPYFFIWNDFAVDQLAPAHRGIKWHRHTDEPEYHYDDPRCGAAIEEIRRRSMPVVLEESFRNTVKFIRDLAPGVRVVIPHLGLLNGGYEILREHGIWAEPEVWTDTALAPVNAVMDYLNRYGHSRMMFGSDFPFGDPVSELGKVKRLGLQPGAVQDIILGNLRRLLANSNTPGEDASREH